VSTVPLAQIRCLIPLHLLPQKQFKRLCSDLVVEKIDEGGFLFVRGDQNSSWFYLLEGDLALEADGIVMECIQGGSEAARFPLAHRVPRKVSARALTRLRFFRIDQQQLDVMEHYQENTEAKFESEKVGKSSDWMGRLFKLPIFQSLPASNLHRILQGFQEVEVSAGTRIIDQGEEADCVYVLSSGRCQVTRRPRPNAKEFKLGEIQVGDLFGEDALISKLPRAVSVTMESDGIVQRLKKEDFLTLVVAPVLSQVSLETALREVEQGSIWLDVRDSDGYQKRHFEDSLNVPFFSLRMQLGTLDRKRRYITVCDKGNLSAAAAFLLLRYGFEASVLEGGVVGVPEKCLHGGMTDQGDKVPEAATFSPVQEQETQEAEVVRREDYQSLSFPASNRSEAVFADPEELQVLKSEKQALEQRVKELQGLKSEKKVLEKQVKELQGLKSEKKALEQQVKKLQALESEKVILQQQVKELQAQISETTRSQKVEVGRLQQSLEQMSLEKRQMEEQGSSLQSRIGELEEVIRQYVEVMQNKEEDEVVQSLQSELEMVREQASMDVSAMRAKLEAAESECQRLQLELTRTTEDTGYCCLPSDLQPVDPQQLPLQVDLPQEVKSQGHGTVLVQGALWFLVGILASLSLVGIGLQTNMGKEWLMTWLQPESYPSVSASQLQTARSVEAVEPSAEEWFAEDQGAVILEDAPQSNEGPQPLSDETKEPALNAQ